MTSRSAPLAVTLGDPAGCGPLITAAAWRALSGDPDLAFYVSGPPALYEPLCPVALIDAPGEARAAFSHALPIRPAFEDAGAIRAGSPDPAAAPAIVGAIDKAVDDALRGDAAAVVTNPINKALLYEAGFKHPGHTEYIAQRCGGARPGMMLVGGGLRVALATIHMPLRETPAAITTESLTEIAHTVHAALMQDFAIPAPRLAFSGLNPHAGEGGALGREELEIINPAAEALRRQGVDITDARPGDTVFAEALEGRYDAVIAMTHDQGLIPVKTLDMWGGVNTTLGLPIIRTSPDHGTAYDAAAAGEVRPDSLIAALRLARAMVEARAHG